MKQPPPRGCVLKRLLSHLSPRADTAAASARLCVETDFDNSGFSARASSRLRAAVC